MGDQDPDSAPGFLPAAVASRHSNKWKLLKLGVGILLIIPLVYVGIKGCLGREAVSRVDGTPIYLQDIEVSISEATESIRPKAAQGFKWQKKREMEYENIVRREAWILREKLRKDGDTEHLLFDDEELSRWGQGCQRIKRAREWEDDKKPEIDWTRYR